MQKTLTGNSFSKRTWKYRYLYALLLPALILVLVFHYLPMYGIVIAFKDFKLVKGIAGSDWIGFTNFRKLLMSPSFYEVIRNTIVISLLKLIFTFPAPIILALMFNELLNQKFKKLVQTISYLPYFMSWVVIGGILINILSPERGIVNYIIKLFGGGGIYFLADSSWFRPVLVMSSIWQGAGWGSVLYLASITGIDSELYEAAKIDGANRLQQAMRITVPLMYPVITVMLILSIGNILNAGFDQVFNLYTPPVYSVADILDTYIYRRGLVESDYGFATAVGLFKNVIGFSLVVGSNYVSKKISEYGVW